MLTKITDAPAQNFARYVSQRMLSGVLPYSIAQGVPFFHAFGHIS